MIRFTKAADAVSASQPTQAVPSLLRAIIAYFIPPVRIDFDPGPDTGVLLARGRERILTALLRFTSVLALFGIASILENLIAKRRWDLLGFYLATAAMVWLVSYYRRINYHVRCFFLLAMVYVLAVVDLLFFGIAEDWQLYLFSFAVLMTIFLGWKAGIVAVLLGELTFVLVALQISAGSIVITASAMISPVPTKMNILTFGLMFLMVTGVVVSALAAVMREFEIAWRQERLATGLVQLERDRLELRVVQRTKELQDNNTRLKAALEDVKTLEGLLPICSQCKKIRDDKGYWNKLEFYISKHSEAEFSHGICPECAQCLYPEIYNKDKVSASRM